MEEVKVEPIDYLEKDIGDFCMKMYHRVGRNNSVTGLVNGIRIIMFVEEQIVDPYYDGPR